MEEQKARKEKKENEHKAYVYDENGKRTEFKYQRKSDKLSPIGVWMKEHPDGVGKILDWRAAMK